MKKIVVLTGAGVSAESGLKTFRDADGLWEGHDIQEVASPEGFAQNPAGVLDFYNQRRRQLLNAVPNKAHLALVDLEKYFEVTIITQNVDDLHERAGSTHVMHLHGELLKVRCTQREDLILDWKEDLHLGDLSAHGYQLRPHIVWFGEQVPLLERAAHITARADILIIIGTSMQVYPAASLVNYADPGSSIYFIDPKPSLVKHHFPRLEVIPETAAKGVPTLVADLIGKIRSFGRPRL
ncbi:MAG: NAD-dependent deacylase [Maribacter sp.]|nr:NAD-dependent deacylase [Maribacter sp.]